MLRTPTRFRLVLSATSFATLSAAILLTSFFTFAASAATGLKTPFKNLDQIAQGLNLATYGQSTSVRTIKIAILDNGFLGYKSEIGKSLPKTVVIHAGPVPVDAKTEEVHGLFMAQLVTGLLAKTPGISYELHLFSSFGYSNLENAVDTIVAEKYDLALYSQVWEYGGNGDGRGFINAVVNRATAAGIIWINAAGNFGDATYRAPVETLADDWAYLPSINHGVRVRCLDNPKKKCNLRAVLSWNDFKDDKAAGTDKDLDLVLSDDTLKILRTGGLQQVVSMPAGDSQGLSLYPREIIEAEITPGIYELRVKVRSHGFTKAKDELRIVTSGDYLEQLDRSASSETLLPPADNPNVITVGATDSPKSSNSVSMAKPETSRDSLVVLENDENYKGSSNSAAMSFALATVFKGLHPEADRAAVLVFLNGRTESSGGAGSANRGSVGRGLPLSVLGFNPLGSGCFTVAILPVIPNPAMGVLKAGAVSVSSDAGFKIMTAEDPFNAGFGVSRKRSDDMLVVDNRGFTVMRRSEQRSLPAGAYEVVQLPQGAAYCSFGF